MLACSTHEHTHTEQRCMHPHAHTRFDKRAHTNTHGTMHARTFTNDTLARSRACAHARMHLDGCKPARTHARTHAALRHSNDTCKHTHTYQLAHPHPHPPAYKHTLKRAHACRYSPSLANCQIQAGTPPCVLHVYISSEVHQLLNDLTISCKSVQIVSIRTFLLFHMPSPKCINS